MRITCPECAHQFEVDPVMVAGRTFKVRCSKCRTRSEVDQRTGEIVGPAPELSTGDTAKVRGDDGAPARSAPAPAPARPARSPSTGSSSTRSAPARSPSRRSASPPKPAPTEEEIATFLSHLDSAHDDMMGLDPLELFGVRPDVSSTDLMKVYTELSEHWRPGKWTGHIPDAEMKKVRAIADRLDHSFNDLSELGRRRRAQQASIASEATKLPPRRSAPAPARAASVPQAEPQSEVEVFYAKGREAFGARRYVEAREAFQQCVTLEPENAIYALRLGEALVRLAGLEDSDDLGPAKVQFDRALELDPENVEVLVGYGHFMKASGQVPKAMRYFKQVRDLEPKHHEANREIRLYLARKRKGGDENTTTGKLKKLLTKKL